MTVVSGSSQSDMGEIKLENWSNSSIKQSSSVTLVIGSWVDGSFSSVIIVSIICLQMNLMKFSFLLCSPTASWNCTSFLFFPKKHSMVSILTDKFLPDQIIWYTWNERSSHWKHIAVVFVIAKFVCVGVAFVSVLWQCFGFEFVTAAICTIVLKVGSSTLVAQACLLHYFNLSDTWYIWGVEFRSAIALRHLYPTLILQICLKHSSFILQFALWCPAMLSFSCLQLRP